MLDAEHPVDVCSTCVAVGIREWLMTPLARQSSKNEGPVCGDKLASHNRLVCWCAMLLEILRQLEQVWQPIEVQKV